jgi:predicted dehydrogenase
MAGTTYKVAVIGRTGRGDYGHGLDVVWKEIAGVEVVAVADEDPAGRAAAAARTGAKNAYADYREMLAKERPRIVSVAPRWIDAHHDMVLACAEHGASVFLEKPMCRSLEEADAMVRACESAHVKLAIAHQTRYSPKVPVVARLLADGRIGEVLEIRGRGKEDTRGGGEDLWVLGTHIFDLTRILGGNARSCFATVSESGRPARPEDLWTGNEGIGPLVGDRVDAMFLLEKGFPLHFSSRRGQAANPTRYGIQILGAKGVIEMSTGYLPEVKLLDDPSWSPGRTGSRWIDVSSRGPGEPEPLPDTGIPGGNIAIVKDLIAAIEEDREPRGGIQEARAATEMIAAVFASHRQGRPVSLPLEDRKNPLAGWG